VINYEDMYHSLSKCNGQVLIHSRQEMGRDIKSMLLTVEYKSRQRFKYYHVDDDLIPNGHLIIGHTHAGRRVIDTFKRFVESGLLSEWERVNLGVKSFNPTNTDQTIGLFKKKEIVMVLICTSGLFAVGLAGLIIEIATYLVGRGKIPVCFHNVSKRCSTLFVVF